MHHTGLYRGQRPGRRNRVGQTLQSVAANDAHVGHTAVAQLGEHRHPLLGTLPTAAGPAHSPSTSRSPSTVMPIAT